MILRGFQPSFQPNNVALLFLLINQAEICMLLSSTDYSKIIPVTVPLFRNYSFKIGDLLLCSCAGIIGAGLAIRHWLNNLIGDLTIAELSSG